MLGDKVSTKGLKPRGFFANLPDLGTRKTAITLPKSRHSYPGKLHWPQFGMHGLVLWR